MGYYPLWSILSGVAFFYLGSSYWGRCYLFGLAFFALSLLLPFKMGWGPLAFGVV